MMTIFMSIMTNFELLFFFFYLFFKDQKSKQINLDPSLIFHSTCEWPKVRYWAPNPISGPAGGYTSGHEMEDWLVSERDGC